MKVQVISLDCHYADRIMYTAARTCYSKESPIKIFYESVKKTTDEMEKLICKALDAGHLSISEHYQFNILIEGVSRALTHQLVRHRHCTFSQQSQRYCKTENGFDYVTPDSVAANKDLKEGFDLCMTTLSKFYDILVKEGVKAEDARAVLPNACTTNIVLTTNLRELMHICNERLCTCAQLEIRRLFVEIKNQVVKDMPWTSKYLVSKCELYDYCNEMPGRGCGKKPYRNK